MSRERVERNIDAALFQIARNILPEVCELQRRTGKVREFLTFGVAIATKVKHKMPDGIRGIDAIIEHVVPGSIAADSLVLAKRAEQIRKRLERNVLRENCFPERDQHGMRRRSARFIDRAKLVFPGVEQFQSPRVVRYLIAQIVRPATVSVDVIKVLMEIEREKPGDDAEILVVVRRKPAGVALSLFRRAALRRKVAGDFELWRRQHLHQGVWTIVE